MKETDILHPVTISRNVWVALIKNGHCHLVHGTLKLAVFQE